MTLDRSNTIICTECRHHKLIEVRSQSSPFQPHDVRIERAHACLRMMSLVTGEPDPHQCESMRARLGGPCGEDGKLYEPISGLPVLGRKMSTVDGPKRVTLHFNGGASVGHVMIDKLPVIKEKKKP